MTQLRGEALIPYERQQRILELLKGRDLVRLDEIQEAIPEASASTLRRDIKELEGAGRIERLQGGAIKALSSAIELPMATKAGMQTAEKAAIARLAAALIEDGDAIYLDSGSTCTALLKELLDRHVTIVTTNTDVFRISQEFVAEITVLGGSYNASISSLSGPLTEENIGKYIFGKAFLGANGIDPRFGVTTPNLVESTKKKAVHAHAQRTYVLADSTKFHKVSAVHTFDLAEVAIVSDKPNTEIAQITALISPEDTLV